MSYTAEWLISLANSSSVIETIEGEDYFYANISKFSVDEQSRIIKAFKAAKEREDNPRTHMIYRKYYGAK